MWISVLAACKATESDLTGRTNSAIGLFSDQHFSQMIPAQEEFQGLGFAEETFDGTIVGVLDLTLGPAWHKQ